MLFLPLAIRNAVRPRVALNVPRTTTGHIPWRASYSVAAGLSRDVIQTRVLDVLKGFEKVDPGKLKPTSSFTDDLGLDSLDAVEVVIAVEEEFSIEIPDVEADEIKTVQQAIDYIAKTPEAH